MFLSRKRPSTTLCSSINFCSITAKGTTLGVTRLFMATLGEVFGIPGTTRLGNRFLAFLADQRLAFI
jgi:hypothetical protein